KGRLSPRVSEFLLREIVVRNLADAEAYVADMVRLPVPATGEDRERMMSAGRILLSTGARAGVEVVWPAMQAHADYGRELVLSLASNREWLVPDIVERWGEHAVADVYIWLQGQFPWSEDPQPRGVFSPGPRYNVGDW